MTEDEFQSNLQEALDNWNDTTVTESATVTLYVDPTGTIRGCRIADPDDADSSLLECYAGKDGKWRRNGILLEGKYHAAGRL